MIHQQDPALTAMFTAARSGGDVAAVHALLAQTPVPYPTIDHLRYKPDVSAVARVVPSRHLTGGQAAEEAGVQPWWFVAYSPSQVEKTEKLRKRSQSHGYPLLEAAMPDHPGTIMLSGPIGLDRSLFKPLQAARVVDAQGAIAGTVLNYNPWRRLVFRRDVAGGDPTVVRVWADTPRTIHLLYSLHQLGAPVLPVLQATAHSIEQPWITGGDITDRLRDPETGAAASSALLPAVAAALARLHGVGIDQLEPQDHLGAPLAKTNAADFLAPVDAHRALQQAAQGVNGLMGDGGENFRAVCERTLAQLDALDDPHVLVHGDFSADQLVLDGAGEPFIIDLDRMKLAPAGYDLGSFSAVELLADPATDRPLTLATHYRQQPTAAPVSERSHRAWTAFHILMRVVQPFRELAENCDELARERVALAARVLQAEGN